MDISFGRLLNINRSICPATHMERKPINLQSSESVRQLPTYSPKSNEHIALTIISCLQLTVARGEAIFIPSIDLRDVAKRPFSNRSIRTPKNGSQSARVAILPVIHGFESVVSIDTVREK